MDTIIKYYQNIVIVYHYIQIIYHYISGNTNKKLVNNMENGTVKSDDIDYFFDNEYIPDKQEPIWF